MSKSVSKKEYSDPKKYIYIKGGRVNNLKNIDVAIRRNALVTVSGLSGSGKSSLAFDTLFAEGQRMYVESLSAYARQFLGRMEKPAVDYIRGVSPAIAIEQKVGNRNPRSTVGTNTEAYDYLKLMFARIGKTYSPISGLEVSRHRAEDVINAVLSADESTVFAVLYRLQLRDGRTMEEELKVLLQKGFSRLIIDGQPPEFIEDCIQKPPAKSADVRVVISRGKVRKDDEDFSFRLADAVETAFFEGEGNCSIYFADREETEDFSERFEADGIVFEEPTVNFFSFNNPYGACKRCEGFGTVLGVDRDLVIPDIGLSVFEGAIAPWRSEKMREDWLIPFLHSAENFDFPLHRPYEKLTPEEQQLLWTGNKHFKGLDAFFAMLARSTHKIKYRVMLSRYRGRTLCPDCRGTRLRGDTTFVKVGGKSLIDLVLMPISELADFFKKLKLAPQETKIAKRLLSEINNRIAYLEQVGLDYLTLNRLTASLSGGEYQRIRLAVSLGSALVGSMYILDEPSIGLHPRDTANLIRVLKSLRDLGNTVIVVEHDEEIIEQSDQIIDIGPEAGAGGGNLVFSGTLNELKTKGKGYTADYLSGKKFIPLPEAQPAGRHFIEIVGAREHNLQNITVKFELGCFTAVTGVSGSGKTTLIKRILYPALCRKLGLGYSGETGKFTELRGDTDKLFGVEMIDQNPIGKSSRSNPVTYIKAYDAIRQLFAAQGEAKRRAYKAGTFSFNTPGGRCDTCEGEGLVKIEMQFMADLRLTCENCKGKRFKSEVLDIKYKDKTISDVLDLTVAESLEFFADEKKITSKIRPLAEVGLGYVKLGQSSASLSGGEAQRVKLASFLSKRTSEKPIMFIFDEPTTGLHIHDIHKLLASFRALTNRGHTLIVIEHNMELVKTADRLIDLGPGGGKNGGALCYEGPVREISPKNEGFTAKYLVKKF